ncbi:MAG: SDR family oxidoreductase [Planctomycetota bacterium]
MPETNPPNAAIVTGGSSGVGRATAPLLAAAGYHVALAARSADKLEQAAEETRAAAAEGVQVLAIPTDVTDHDAVTALVDRTVAELGGVTALCNVAGHAPLGPIPSITSDEWQKCIDANLSSVIFTTQAVWKPMQKTGGTIVNVSSMSSIDPFKGFAMYAAAKIGVNMFTKCTAEEGARRGIKAVCLAPGAIETPMLRQNFNEKVIHPDHALDPAEFGQIIVDLVLGARDYNPGETLVVEAPKPVA